MLNVETEPRRNPNSQPQFTSLVLSFVLTINTWSAFASFNNLNFEQANVPAIPQSTTAEVSIADGIPGWMGFIGTNQVSSILHNGVTLGAPAISILGPDYFPINILEGNYTALLEAGENGLNLIDVSIAQIGFVPSTAVRLQFKSIGSTQPLVSFAGQVIPYAPIGSGTNYVLYAGDVSQFAGEVGELRFSTTAMPQFRSEFLLDSIAFSSVPEPGVLTLTAVAGLLFAALRWQRSRRK